MDSTTVGEREFHAEDICHIPLSHATLPCVANDGVLRTGASCKGDTG